ncbi:unnamed protein product, partial [Ixodes persulcatus]
MQWSAKKLDKKDFWGKSDPFLVFLKSNEDGRHTLHTFEKLRGFSLPIWQACAAGLFFVVCLTVTFCIQIWESVGDGADFTTVHKTEVVKNNLSPTWRPCVIKSTTLCSGDPDRPLKVQCYDWDSDGSHDLIGEFSCTLRTLQKGPCAENVYQ